MADLEVYNDIFAPAVIKLSPQTDDQADSKKLSSKIISTTDIRYPN